MNNIELINTIVVQTAKLLAKEMNPDKHTIEVLIAEILASDYRKRSDKTGSRDLIFNKAESLVAEIISKDIEHA